MSIVINKEWQRQSVQMQGICRYGKTLSTAFEKVINRKGVKKLVDSGHNFGENLRNFAKCAANYGGINEDFF